MTAHVNVSGWRSVVALYVNVSGWKTVKNGYVNVAGTWRTFFTSVLTPTIASRVTISRSNATYPSTLTGTNFRWTNSTSLTYVFQKSSDNSNFVDIGSPAFIANPSAGSSNTVTYALTLADMPAYTSYYRFVVTAVNSTYSTSATSTSTSVSVNRPAPLNTVAPVISPTSGTAGVTTYSVVSNGTWNPEDADGIYAYQWQYNDQGSTFVSISGATNSTYSPPSNFLSLYVSPIRCRVTATNPSGSTDAFSNTATVASAFTVPTAPLNLSRTLGNGGSKTFTWSAPANDGGTAITSYQYNLDSLGWFTTSSNSSQSLTLTAGDHVFQVRAVNAVGAGAAASTGSFRVPTINSGPSASSITSSSATISWTSSNQSSYTLTISGSDTVYTGTTGTSVSISGLAFGTTYTPTLTIRSSTTDTATTVGSSFTTTTPVPVNTSAPTISPGSGTAGSTTFSSTTGSWTNSPTSFSYQWRYFDSGLGAYQNLPSANLSTYLPPSNYVSLYGSNLICRVTANNSGGSSLPADSSSVTVNAPVVIPSGGTVSISTNTGNYNVGSIITYSTSGWSGSPTSYSLRLYNGTNPVLTSDPLRASTSSSSGTYTITTSDVSKFFKAFATATNSAGTSAEASSTQVGPAVQPAPVNTVAPAVTPTSGTAGVTTYSCTTGTWNNSPTSFAYQWQYNDQGSTFVSISGATNSTYSPPSNFNSLYVSPIRCRVTATNDGGSTQAFSNTATVSTSTTVPGTVNSLTATSSLSGTNLNWSASWSAPSSNGGAAITGYRIYVERAGSSSGPWLATTTQSPAGTGAFTQASPRLVSSATTSVSGRVTSTSATWIRVWVAAVNSVGTGAYTDGIG